MPIPNNFNKRENIMKVIVAVDANWAIGNKGNLLISIPLDHKNFRKETMGKVVVLGRKTLATFPSGIPLDGRDNIILSANQDYKVRNAVVAHSVDEVLEEAKKYKSDDVYVIGGSKVYEELLPYCDTCIVTKIDREFEADKYFPNLEKLPEWELTDESDEQVCFDTTYCFQTYKRKK